MNRAQTQALVDLWDDIHIALSFTDIGVDEVNVEVRDEGDDIETLTGEPGWVEVIAWIQGSGPLMILDPRGVLHRETSKEDSDEMIADPCKIICTKRGENVYALNTEPI